MVTKKSRAEFFFVQTGIKRFDCSKNLYYYMFQNLLIFPAAFFVVGT